MVRSTPGSTRPGARTRLSRSSEGLLVVVREIRMSKEENEMKQTKTPRSSPGTWFVLTIFLFLSSSPTWAQSAADIEKFSGDKLHEERAYTLGTAAFIWGFPMNELYRVRAKSVSQGHKVNAFNHARKLFTAEQAIKLGVVRANERHALLSCLARPFDRAGRG